MDIKLTMVQSLQAHRFLVVNLFTFHEFQLPYFLLFPKFGQPAGSGGSQKTGPDYMGGQSSVRLIFSSPRRMGPWARSDSVCRKMLSVVGKIHTANCLIDVSRTRQHIRLARDGRKRNERQLPGAQISEIIGGALCIDSLTPWRVSVCQLSME